ncbi:MAG: hypothetical protein JWN44_6651, partial [Myxococcales bacterium]|nr:hypothetical protein [Myxococcales bacterium]
MTPRLRDRLAAPVVAIYWAALVVGLVVYSTARDDASEVAALWAGAVAGTVLGQALALENLRGWLAALIVGGVALLFAPMLAAGGAPTVLWQALLPAALCGYLSLGERTAAAAFWFPAMTWMLTVVDRLDGDDAAASMDARAFVLLGGVAAALLAMLWAAEHRRLGLWRSVGRVSAGQVATLREPAGRTLARIGWWASVATLTVALTAWVAPHLWQSETLGGQRVTEFADGVGVGDRDGVPCCPLVSAEAPRVRVREFLDLAHGVTRPPARVGVNCASCEGNGWIVAGAGVGPAAVAMSTTPRVPTTATRSSLRPTAPTVQANPVVTPTPPLPSPAAPPEPAPSPPVAGSSSPPPPVAP